MSKPNAKPSTELPTEWRRIVMEEDEAGNVRPVAVEPVSPSILDTSTGGRRLEDSTSVETSAADPTLDGAPEEWQDAFRSQVKPIPPPPSNLGGEGINLQSNAPDFAEKTLTGMSFPEFYEGHLPQEESATSSAEEATQRQEGMWEQQSHSPAATESDAFPFSAPPAASVRQNLVVPEADFQAGSACPPPGILNEGADLSELSSSPMFPETTQTLTTEQARLITESQDSASEVQEEHKGFASPQDPALLESSAPPSNPALPSAEGLGSFQPAASSSEPFLESPEESTHIDSGSSSVSVGQEVSPSEEWSSQSEAAAVEEEEVVNYSEPTQLALPPTKGGWDGTISAPEVPPSSGPEVDAASSTSLDGTSQEAFESNDTSVVAVSGGAESFALASNVSLEATAEPIANEDIASGTSWQQVLSMQQQVAAQMADVVHSLQGQVSTNHTLIRELLMLFDFIDLRLSVIGQPSDPRWQEMASVRSKLLDILSLQGLVRLSLDDLNQSHSNYHVVQEVDTMRPEEDGQILRIVREGFRQGETLLRPAEVEINRYNL